MPRSSKKKLDLLYQHRRFRLGKLKVLDVQPFCTVSLTPRSRALPQTAANAQKRKLSPIEEQSLVKWILGLGQRGFPPQIIDVRRMADNLLAARGQEPLL